MGIDPEIIERLRRKLVDQSLANPLLNFGARRRKFIRIVDASAAALFDDLLAGVTFSFAPLPEPTAQDLEAASPPGGPGIQKKDLDLTAWAASKGVNPDYDLTGPGSSMAAEGQRRLQTLLLRDALDAMVRTLGQEARSALNETGSNMLYCLFGALEWTAGGGERSLTSPLVLAPLSLTRPTPAAGLRAYKAGWSGDDVQTNLALEIKLKSDFDIVLPGWDGEAGLDAYFAKVEEALKSKPEWRVRRHVTITLMSQLGRLLLYRDLDPANWGGGAGIGEHPLVRLLLGGGVKGAARSFGRDDVSPETIAQEVLLPLVDRADTSQLEAVRLALSGESLVIQGPPGTGKSQTITNIIAGCLDAGKSVLFVAEKQAALDVVSRRLDSMGLGQFCLDLHSNRTQRRELLDAVRSRIEAPGPTKPGGWKQNQDELNALKRSLDAYAEAVGSVGPQGEAAATLLFRAGACALPMADRMGAVLELGLPDLIADGLASMGQGAADVDRRQQTLAYLAEAHEALGWSQPIARHPWNGVRATNIQPDDLPSLRRELEELRTALSAAQAQQAAIERQCGIDLSRYAPTDLIRASQALSHLADGFPIVDAAAREMRAAARPVEAPVGLDWGSLKRFLTAARLASLAPVADMKLWRPSLLDDSARALLQKAVSDAAELENRRQRLDAQLPGLRLAGVDAGRLREAGTTLRDTAVIARAFSAHWKEAIALLRSLQADLKSRKAPLWAEPLFEVAEWLEAVERRRNDRDFERVFGERAATASEFDRLGRLLDWRDRVVTEFRGNLADRRFGQWMLTLDGDALEHLAGLPLTAAKAAAEWAKRMFAASADVQAGAEIWEETVGRLLPGPIGTSVTPMGSSELAAFAAAFESFRSHHALATERRAALSARLSEAGAAETADTATAIRLCDSRLDGLSSLLDWSDYLKARAGALDSATAPLIEAAEHGHPLFADLPAIWRFAAHRAFARQALNAQPVLHEQTGRQQQARRNRFRACDEQAMQDRRSLIAAKLHGRGVPAGVYGQRVRDHTQMALLRQLMGQTQPRIAIRELLDRAGAAVKALKPCFMMGPLSVAQYLKPGGLTFDVVIMDEASQMRPEDALSAVARGGQIVVVGDDRQLPPTNFFNVVGTEPEDDDEDEGPVAGETDESILALAAKVLPDRMLRWHYRSRDESLIAFCNHAFYDNRLIVFPGPKKDPDRFGVVLEYIEGASVVRGLNDLEARRVAKAAVEHLRTRPAQSLIVVAMNVAQRDRIQAHFDELTRNDPIAVRAEDEEGRGEPFEIKNLENVQGDERDVVMISMTYGPEPGSGRVHQRFGPINSTTGHRRLNVLFSRAREKMVVFTSMHSHDVLTSETSRSGVQALHDFLVYSETRRLPGKQIAVGTGRDPESDFEIAVSQALRDKGYVVEAQLGVDGFFLDLAIRDPDEPGRFLLAVECDGASYHSSRSARDRDRLRQDILEGLGWRIERIWSTDWYRDPAKEIRRVVAAVEEERDRLKAGLVRAGVAATVAGDTAAVLPEEVLIEEPPRAAERPAPTPRQQRRVTNDRQDEGPLTQDEALDRLYALKHEMQLANPNVPPEAALLRGRLLEALLRRRPTDFMEFRDRIALRLREKTDGDQLHQYGDRVFDILRRIDH